MNDSPSYRLIAAALIVAIYFVVAGVALYLVIENSVPAEKWSQIVVIFNAVGALATTAAGVLLGAEVQQANVNFAMNRAKQAIAVAVRKDEAARAALEQLESSAGATAGGSSAVSQARLTLQRSLGVDASEEF